MIELRWLVGEISFVFSHGDRDLAVFFLLKRVKLLFVLVMHTLFLRVVFLFLSCFEIIGFLMSLILIFNDSKRELLGCRINETEL